MAEFTFALYNPTEPDSQTRKKPRQKRAQPKLTPSLYKASVKITADTGTAGAASTPAGLDDDTLQRIRKCLERANHKSTTESEAKAAFFVASRLMGQYNVSQAEVLAQEPADTQKKFAGQSVVSIKHADGSSKRVNNQGFVRELALTMQDSFECKSYSTTKNTSVEWTFYGIAENTVAAAMGFEVAYNLTSEWARPYKGIASKNSYCMGVASELRYTARMERLDQEAKARQAETESLRIRVEQEEAHKRAELDRLANFPTEPEETIGNNIDSHMEIDNDDAEETDKEEHATDFVEKEFKADPHTNLDDEIASLAKPKLEPMDTPSNDSISTPLLFDCSVNQSGVLPNQGATSASPSTINQREINNSGVKSLWMSSMQLTVFRENASKIADDYLNDLDVKLSHHTARYAEVKDHSAYMQGKRDSKKIDIRRKRIGG